MVKLIIIIKIKKNSRVNYGLRRNELIAIVNYWIIYHSLMFGEPIVCVRTTLGLNDVFPHADARCVAEGTTVVVRIYVIIAAVKQE